LTIKPQKKTATTLAKIKARRRLLFFCSGVMRSATVSRLLWWHRH
jgi:hypothetical protein